MSLSVNPGDALEQAKARQEAAKQAKETAEKAKADAAAKEAEAAAAAEKEAAEADQAAAKSEKEAADVTGTQVTLKGSADGYALAVWNEGGYAYAVSVTKKITKDEILRIVEEIVKK